MSKNEFEKSLLGEELQDIAAENAAVKEEATTEEATTETTEAEEAATTQAAEEDTTESKVKFESDAAAEKETTQSGEKKSRFKNSFKSLNFRGGAYASGITAIVIILVIAINLIVGHFDISLDLTTAGLYSITEETKEFVSSIEDTIKLYYFVQAGSEEANIEKIIEKYDGLGKNIELITVDPILHPNYAGGLIGTEEASTLETNSVIVVNETNGRTKLVLYSDMIVTSYDYTTYSTVYTSDVEGQIDSALMYVTNENLPVMYVVTGHGETSVSDTMNSLITKNNVTTEELDTMTTEEIPEDCDILFINLPIYDYLEEEVELIEAYLDAGGKAIFNIDYRASEMTNFNDLLNYYGVELVQGLLIETDSRYYTASNPTYLLPSITTHDLTSGVKGKKRVFVPQASGLRVLDSKRDTITVTNLLTTSDSAFSKVDLYSSTATKEDADIDGPFAVAMYIEETYNNVTSKLLIYSSTFIWDDSIISTSTYGNADLFLNGINYIANVESTFSVPTQNLSDVSYLDLTTAQANANVLIKMVLLPLACLIAGGTIIILRRRRV